tara:strand:+ start:293 stop:880 length:588 start_codon:yes stop_codon:yes gene_type:complete
MTQIKIGIDLDNTIINYHNSFKKYLRERRILLKNINKEKVKFIANNNSKIKNWTEAQEEIYGKYIVFAKLFKFFEEFEKFALNKNMKLYIVSHKTKYSQFSKKYNLHTQSNKWIKKNIIKDKYQIFYVNTINEKIKQIAKIKPNYFIDDLLEVFDNKNFPKNVKKIHFSKTKNEKILTLNNWRKIKKYIENNETF